MRRLISEIHRRSIWQVLGVYVVGSYVGYEAILALTDGVGLPAWVPPLAIVLFIIGLPVVLATAVVQEGHPLRRDDGPAGPRVPGLEHAGDAVAPGDRPADRPADPSAEAASRGGGRGHFLTWHRAITAGVLAFALLGLAATGFLGMRALGIGPAATLVSSGALEAKSPLVVADFEALSGDTSLASVVTEGLRADLAQSDFVTVADRPRIVETLSLMMRPADAPLDAATAREVATRLGLKAVVEGEVGRAGAGYVLTSRVVTADSGRTLATFRETAADSTALVPAIEALSHALRERVGESLRTVRASSPLAQVTTSSLPALRLAVAGLEAERAGNRRRAIRLMEQAIELDPGFAWAWRLLATFHYNNQDRARTLEAIDRALENADRLSPNGRLATRGFRATIVGDHGEAVRAIRRLLEQDTLNATRWTNLSDHLWNMGRWDEAASTAARAVALEPENWVARWNHVIALVDGGRLPEARAAAEEAVRVLDGRQSAHNMRGMALAGLGRFDSIHDLESNHYRRVVADRVRGRWAELRAHFREIDQSEYGAIHTALAEMLILGSEDAAATVAGTVERVEPGDELPEGIVAEMAAALAMAGRPDDARRARAVYEARVPAAVRWGDAHLLEAVDAFIALDEGRVDDALAGLRRARQLTVWTAPVDAMLARAYDVIDRPDSAIAAYTRYLETPWSARVLGPRILNDGLFRGPAHARLAALHEEAGDMDAAARHAAALVDLWSDADAAFQPRVAAARRILERATGEGR